MDIYFCRAAQAQLAQRELRCECCPLYRQGEKKGSDNCCLYNENHREFPDFAGAGMYDRTYLPLQEALQFAAMAHKGSLRKGSSVPYILHPMEAAMTTLEMTEDLELAMAAALHDVIEDTSHGYEEIKDRFGKKVADIVLEESENKRRDMTPEQSWKLRKEEGIQRIAQASASAKIVALSDKLSNMRATHRDYENQGDTLFARFHCKEKSAHEWYHRGLLKALSSLADTEQYREYRRLYEEVFLSGEFLPEDNF